MPFDIATLNCYAYKIDNPKELVSVLEARLAMALPEPADYLTTIGGGKV
ncbi:MAG: hypothetical protein HND43_07100 [Armatimonadetes bacterium]|uniref:Uncharacterized protein n=1 Tax=Candidatus Nitrosymbiomonas proteolyticus TaxID=2608984 RepID=A0A809R854_9BACT|nr:hypothetical protein [Armatimonadota bacterium]BBO23763.1 hypothetical protein NPRO_13580 [Candidatus Nitrosymbiomonas proteolyticus]